VPQIAARLKAGDLTAGRENAEDKIAYHSEEAGSGALQFVPQNKLSLPWRPLRLRLLGVSSERNVLDRGGR
jgi:hypothetical protein